MSEEELGAVQNFVIQNEHGKLEYLEPVDLRWQNLEEIIQIKPSEIVVYPDDGTVAKHEPGEGLNQPAIISLYNIFPKGKLA